MAGEGATCGVDNCSGDEKWKFFEVWIFLVELVVSENTGSGIQSIENCLDKDDVNTTVNKTLDLLLVGIN